MSTETRIDAPPKEQYFHEESKIIAAVRELRNIKSHPHTAIGLWCAHTEKMSALLPFLADSLQCCSSLWSEFRSEVSSQIANCRQCAIAYHKAVSTWETSDTFGTYLTSLSRDRIQSLISWDIERIYLPIKRSAHRPTQNLNLGNTQAAHVQGREAFFEVCLSLRLSADKRIIEVLWALFMHRSPVKSSEDFHSFLKKVGFMPPGVAFLCFHPKEPVRSWAIRTFDKFSPEFHLQEAQAIFIMSKIWRCLYQRAGLEMPNPKSPFVSLSRDGLLKGISSVLSSLDNVVCSQLVTSRPGAVIRCLADMLNNQCEAVMKSACSCIEALIARVSFKELFDPSMLTVNRLTETLLRIIRDPTQTSSVRTCLFDLLEGLLERAKECQPRAPSIRLTRMCFDSIEAVCLELAESLPSVCTGRNDVNFLNNEKARYHAFLEMGARIMSSLLVMSAPYAPLTDHKRLTNFIFTSLRADPTSVVFWGLLRAALLVDVFNIIHCVFESDDFHQLSNSFLSRPEGMSWPADEKKLLTDLLSAIHKGCPVVTFNCALWDEVRKSHSLLQSQACIPNEVKTFLELHRLFGSIDSSSISLRLTAERMTSLDWSEVHGISSDNRKYINDNVHVMQGVIFERLLKSMQARPKEEWPVELPFHATHLLSSAHKELCTEAMGSLLEMYNLQAATVGGSKAKLVGHALKNNLLHAEWLSSGFVSSIQMLYHWGTCVTMVTYARFFLWYRVLLDLNFEERLSSYGSHEWVVGVILSFLNSWRRFERENKSEEFQEACCRFLTNLRDIWISLFGNVDKATDSKMSKFIPEIISGLLDMHKLRDPVPRGTWVQTINRFAQYFQGDVVFREKIHNLIDEHACERGRLTLAQCEMLASSLKLENVESLSLWAKDDERHKQQLQRAVAYQSGALLNSAPERKSLRSTKIDDHFSTARSAKTSKTASVASNNTLANSFLNRVSKAANGGAAKLHDTQASEAKTENVHPAPNGNRFGHSKVAELRKDLKQARQEVGKSIGKPVPVQKPAISLNAGPVKTKFEIAREQFKLEHDRKRRERQEALQHSKNKMGIHAGSEPLKRKKSNLPVRDQGDNDRNEASPKSSPLNDEPEDFGVPARRRVLNCDTFGRIYRSLIQRDSGFDSVDRTHQYSTATCKSFSTVNDYVKFWEPLLVEEFRATIRNAQAEERSFFSQHGEACRLEFLVESHVEAIGYQQSLNVCFDLKQKANQRNKGAGEDFDPTKARIHDILILDCPSRYLDSNANRMPNNTSFALVDGISVSKGNLCFKLSTAFSSLEAAPGKGVRIRVSRLASTITLERQLEALRALDNVSDGILWPILESNYGWTMLREVSKRVDEDFDTVLSSPLGHVEKMTQKNVLNKSQADAINSVVRACAPVFRCRKLSKRSYSDFGGISLIQGPPGTGKTSTIIALLSTLLFANSTNTKMRKAAVDIDGSRSVIAVPPIRILVCAPSNAAVDELMSRVIEEGLSHPTGGKACTRVVRVGGGSTIKALQDLELRNLAKCDVAPSPLEDAISRSEAQKREHLNESRRINDKIHEVDKEQKSLRQAIQELPEDKENAEKKLDFEEKLKKVTANLKALHGTKNGINNAVSADRENVKQAEELKKRENDGKMASIINSAAIVFATVNSSGHEVLHRLGARFDVVIVDEAAQCIEPDVIIPVTAGRRSMPSNLSFAHLVLVGDPKQLPATILSEKRSVSTRLGCSMFERFAKFSPDEVHMLNTQYRMHPKISAFPSQQFYQGLLKDGDSVLTEKMNQPYHSDPDGRFGPLTFLNTSSCGFREIHSSGGSIHNPDEARFILDAVIALVRKYPSCDFQKQIAVLSPYREQVVFLKRLFARHAATRTLEVEVNTIDGIQGREKSIVFLSTVRGINARSIGFVRDERRMNVAITRSKYSSVIVGNASLLRQHSSAWEALISQCANEKLLLDVPSNPRLFFPENPNNYTSVRNPVRRHDSAPKVGSHHFDAKGVTMLRSVPCHKRLRSTSPQVMEKECEGRPRKQAHTLSTKSSTVHVDTKPSLAKGLNAKTEGFVNGTKAPFSKGEKTNLIATRRTGAEDRENCDWRLEKSKAVCNTNQSSEHSSVSVSILEVDRMPTEGLDEDRLPTSKSGFAVGDDQGAENNMCLKNGMPREKVLRADFTGGEQAKSECERVDSLRRVMEGESTHCAKSMEGVELTSATTAHTPSHSSTSVTNLNSKCAEEMRRSILPARSRPDGPFQPTQRRRNRPDVVPTNEGQIPFEDTKSKEDNKPFIPINFRKRDSPQDNIDRRPIARPKLNHDGESSSGDQPNARPGMCKDQETGYRSEAVFDLRNIISKQTGNSLPPVVDPMLLNRGRSDPQNRDPESDACADGLVPYANPTQWERRDDYGGNERSANDLRQNDLEGPVQYTQGRGRYRNNGQEVQNIRNGEHGFKRQNRVNRRRAERQQSRSYGTTRGSTWTNCNEGLTSQAGRVDQPEPNINHQLPPGQARKPQEPLKCLREGGAEHAREFGAQNFAHCDRRGRGRASRERSNFVRNRGFSLAESSRRMRHTQSIPHRVQGR